MRHICLAGLFIALAVVGPAAHAAATTTGDTYVDSSSATATKNYGSSGIIAVSPTRIALIRFGSSAISQTGGTATLNLKVFLTKNEHNAVSVHLVRGPWSESTVTSRTLPPMETIALDEKTISRADQGKIVSFDITGALAAWRNDPSQNFGIAITPSTPLPNLQFGARELEIGATMDVGGPALDAESRLWILQDDLIQLSRADGSTVFSAKSIDGRFLTNGTLAADPIDGGVWMAVANSNRVMRLGPTGELALSINAVLPGPIAVDRRSGDPWVAIQDGDTTRQIVKLDRNGQTLVSIKGFGPNVSAIAVDESTGVVWASASSSVIRLSGTDAQLNGYDVSAASGPRHTRISGFAFLRSLAVNSNRDSQGSGNVWVGDGVSNANSSPVLVTKLSRTGSVLLRPTINIPFIYEARDMTVNPLTGTTWALMGYGSYGIAKFPSSGTPLQFSLIFMGVPDDSKLSYIPIPTHIILDPYRDLLWASVVDFRPKISDFPRADIIAMDAMGHEVRHFTVPGQYSSLALQSIGASLTIGSGGAVNLSQTSPITVGILSRGGFDALQVEPGHVRFGPGRAAPIAFRAKDLNGDGVTDLALDFSIPDTGIACGDLYAGLTAANSDAVPVAGNAAITTTGCAH